VNEVVLLSFTAALNPTLLTATTVMLLLPKPGRLMLGYWLGAMMTSITLGIVIVYALQGSGVVSTTKRTVSPVVDIALGAIALVLALVLLTGRHERLAEARARRKQGKEPPRWQRSLSTGTARTTFVVGALLTLPGASYLAALARISKLDYATVPTVLVIAGVNLVMLVLLEIPLVAFSVSPERTAHALDRMKAWAAAHGRRAAGIGLGVVGTALVIKGIVGLLQ
jgi:hypothetical protein